MKPFGCFSCYKVNKKTCFKYINSHASCVALFVHSFCCASKSATALKVKQILGPTASFSSIGMRCRHLDKAKELVSLPPPILLPLLKVRTHDDQISMTQMDGGIHCGIGSYLVRENLCLLRCRRCATFFLYLLVYLGLLHS